jgi:putative ATP-dependent DNA ligase
LKNKLGAALLEGMHDTLRQYRERQLVYRTFRCRFRQRANAELMLRDLRRRLGGGQIKLRQLQKAGDYYLLEFDKLTPKTKDHLDYLLRGGLIFD